MESLQFALPRCCDLSRQQLDFLEENFSTHEDLLRGPDVLEELKKRYETLDSLLVNLQRNLRKQTVAFISHSIGIRSSLQNLNFRLQNLSLYTSTCGTYSKTVEKTMDEELPLLVKQVWQIGNICKYVETALRLEALVGDLEDAVLFLANFHTGITSSAKFLNASISKDFGTNHEKLLLAIKAMNEIEDMLKDILKLQPQWHHLLKSVDARVDKNLTVLRPQVLADHRALLVSLGWPPKLLTSKADSAQVSSLPNPLVLMQGEKKKHYSHSFLGLCALQHLQARREERQGTILGKKDSESGLWAVNELVSPIAARMEYHFLKWVDQPEFIFALVHKVTKDFMTGVDDVLQPLIDEARLLSCSAKEAWVSAMVCVLSLFLKNRVFGGLAERYKDKNLKSEVMSSWLHLIDLCVSYDKQTQSLVNLETGSLTSEFEIFEGVSRGLSVLAVFSDKPNWLKLWAKIELKASWKKLKIELKDDKAWIIGEVKEVGSMKTLDSEEYVLSTREDHKAPVVAQSVIKIAWEMIERCQTLPDISLRIQFIRSTAVRFFWHFINVMLLQYKEVDMHCSNTNDDTLKRVCGLINAAKYFETNLREWSDNVSFVELRIVETNSVISRTDENSDSMYFFGEEIKSLAELETNWLMDMITAALHQFESTSWGYFDYKEYFEQELDALTSTGVSMEITVSDYLLETLDALRSQLHVLKASLNSKDFVDFWRSVTEGLDHFIYKKTATSDIHFSDRGVHQFEADMQALFSIFRPFCTRPQAFFPCIRETISLLKMKKEEVKDLIMALSSGENPKKCLHSVGISCLQYPHVVELLKCCSLGT